MLRRNVKRRSVAIAESRFRGVALADFRGKLVPLYFGYATCPDVCPTDLGSSGRRYATSATQATRCSRCS